MVRIFWVVAYSPCSVRSDFTCRQMSPKPGRSLGWPGHCPQNSGDVLFFLCEQVLFGPQISLHLFEKQRHLSEESRTMHWGAIRLLPRSLPFGVWLREKSLRTEMSAAWRDGACLGHTERWTDRSSSRTTVDGPGPLFSGKKICSCNF